VGGEISASDCGNVGASRHVSCVLERAGSRRARCQLAPPDCHAEVRMVA
jgi:hypothetical protein